MKKPSTSSMILAISTLKNVMDIFFGPFLAAYYVSTSIEGLPVFSTHMLALYAAMSLCSVAVFVLCKGRTSPRMFYVGVVFEFLVTLLIVVLKEKVVTYAIAYGIVRAISTEVYWFPFNQFSTSCIPDNERKDYETKKMALLKLSSIIIPIVFAGMISAMDFVRSSGVILVVSVVMIVICIRIRGEADKTEYSVKDATAFVKGNGRSKMIIAVNFMRGMFETTVGTLLPVLLYMQKSSNMSLGLVTAGASLVFIVIQFVMNALHVKKNLNPFWVTGYIASALVYAIWPSFTTAVILNVVYVTFYGFLSIDFISVYFLSLKEYRGSYLFTETSLNLGRMTGFLITLIVVTAIPQMLSWLMVGFLLLMIPSFAVFAKYRQ